MLEGGRERPGRRNARTGRRHEARVALAIALLAALFASPAATQQLSIHRFTADDGLAGSQIWDVRVDRRGLLWAASTWGFSRYDGEQFSILSVQDGLPSPNARTVIEDAEGRLWFGTGDGVARYDGALVEAMGGLPDAPRGNVWASTVDRAGRLWFATENGLVRFADGGFRRYGAADGLASDYAYSVFTASDGALYVGARGEGFARCQPTASGELGNCRRFSIADGLGSGSVRAFAEERSGRILVGTRGGGVAIWDGTSLGALRAADGLPSDDVYALAVRRSGVVAIGTSKGLALCLGAEPGRCRTLGEANGLPNDEVLSLFEDTEQTLWIGTEGGLAQLVRDELWSYGTAEGLPDPNVYSVAWHPDGTLWAGTVSGLVALRVGRHGEPELRRFGTEAGLPSPWVWSLEIDRWGRVWAGTESGLCRFEAGRCRRFGVADGLPSNYVLSLAAARDALWVGTNAGVARISLDADGEVGAIDAYRREQGLARDRVYALAVDGEGRTWAAHGEALSLFEGDRFRSVPVGEGFGARSMRGLGLDRSGRLLVGAFGQIARHEGGLLFRRWSRSAGIDDEMILTLAEDDRGRLLLGGHRGLVLFDPEGDAGRGEVVGRLDRSGGTIAAEVSHSEAFARDGEGGFWFGFRGGLTRVPAAPLPDSLPAPAIDFSRLDSERGRSFVAPFLGLGRGPSGWLGGTAAEFPHDDAHLRATVRAASFRQRAELRYQFRQEGESWGEPGADPFVELTRLSAGEHRLEARAVRGRGEPGPVATVVFRIRSAWWQSATFAVGAALAVAAAVAAVASALVRRRHEVAAEVERQIAERTDDLARYAAALGDHLQTVDRASDRSRRFETGRRELFARTSHELRTPLTAILGFSELLERSLAERLDERDRRYLANIRESGELLLRQVNNLLDQLKLEAGRMELHLEEISLATLLESVASLMEGYALHRGVRLELAPAAELPPVRTDLAKLRQVLMNVLSNAIKFSPAGETVTVAAEMIEESGQPLPSRSYRISIRDRGPGIPTEALEEIFEPYRQLGATASGAAGTGLGLSISRQFVELLGGRIEVESQPGQGAVFRIVLPAELRSSVAAVEVSDSGGFEPARPQLVVVDRDRDRFARLSATAGSADLLAVRADGPAALPRMLATLRPRAAVLVWDEARGAPSFDELQATMRQLASSATPLVLLAVADGRALQLPIGAALELETEEAAARRALRAVGVAAKAPGRRPLALIAAARESGIRFGALLASAGCDHFRVEGDETGAALAEVTPDLVAVDWPHALALLGDRGGGESGAERRPPIVLIDAGAVGVAELTRLAARCRDRGEPIESALAAGLSELLGS